MNQLRNLRKLAIIVLIMTGLLTLAACKSGERTPYGSISDDPYLTIGDIVVTEKELYDQLRLQGASVLATMVDEKIFAEELTTVKGLLASGDEDLNKYLDETINNAIHGGTDLESLEKMSVENPERWVRNIEQFADSLYLLDNSIDIAQVIASIQGLSGKYEGYSSIPVLVERYGLRVTQRYYAQQILEEEVIDEDHANFIKEADLVNSYRNSMQGIYDVNALIVRFINLNEANTALYKASIKSDSRGLWYKIPDIRILPGEPGYVDLTDLTQTGYGHVKTILENLDILGKLGNDFEDRENITFSDYENYYKQYSISTSRDTGLTDEALTTAQVKAEFVNIYNMLSPASQVEVDGVTGDIVGVDEESTFNSTVTYDDLTALNSSLRVHIYTTLTAEAQMDDPDDVSEGKPYSARVQTFGSSRYLVFKLDDESDSEDGILVDDPENEDVQIFGDSEEALEIKGEIYERIFNGKLNSNYISSKVNELYEDLNLNIYDSVLRIFYEQSFGYDGATDTKNGEVVAEIGDIEILVDEFYQRLEKSYGINLALDIASNKILMANEDYSVTEEEFEDYKSQFEDIISQFSADNFATSGFPASMGREKFLLVAFGARTNTEAVNQLYVYPALREQYLTDIEGHFGTENYTIYEKLADLAELQYSNFKSINVSHLLVYFDENGDGTPDNPTEYLEGLGEDGAALVLDGLVDLVELIYSRIGNYRGLPEGLTAIATEFNNSGRIERGDVKTIPYDYQIELLWAEYRQLGFYLKFENISSAITNTSNKITGQSVLDPVFYDRAMALHAELEEIEEDASKFPHLDLFGTVITESALEEVKSSFGWHLILATNVRKTTSAIFSASDDEDGKYVSADETLNVYNEDSDTLTASQIEFYLTEQKTDEGVVLPSSVQTSVNNYLTPVLNRYNNTYMQRELIFKLLEDATWSSAQGEARFEVVREINRRQLNEYLLSTVGVFDQNYEDLYGSWFTILESGL